VHEIKLEEHNASQVATELAARLQLVYLSTFEFQAPGFYAKQGYSVIGELENVPAGSKRQWFSKVLTSEV
jgi:hypothetical protein